MYYFVFKIISCILFYILYRIFIHKIIFSTEPILPILLTCQFQLINSRAFYACVLSYIRSHSIHPSILFLFLLSPPFSLVSVHGYYYDVNTKLASRKKDTRRSDNLAPCMYTPAENALNFF